MTKQHTAFTIHVNASKGIAHLQQIQEWLTTVQKTKPEGISLVISYDPDVVSNWLILENPDDCCS